MRSRGIRLAYTIAIVYAFISTFLMLQLIDRDGVLQADQLYVLSGQQNRPSQEITDKMEQLAQDEGLVIGRLMIDALNPSTVRNLYLAVGEKRSDVANWLQDGYPSFAQEVETKTYSMGTLGQSGIEMLGQYFVMADEGKSVLFESAMRDLGFEVSSRKYFDIIAMGQWLFNQPIGQSGLIALLLVVLLVAASVVSGVKGYAVQRLHGAEYGQLFIGDIRKNGSFVGVVLLLSAGLFLLYLWHYNSFSQWQLYILVVSWVLVIFCLFALLAHLIALTIVCALPILESLKGKISAQWAMLGVYAVRLPALLVAALSIILTQFTLAKSIGYLESREAWRSAGNAVMLNFSPDLSQSESDKYMLDTGEWLIEEEAKGSMILAQEDKLDYLIGYEDFMPGVGADIVLVNDNYLAAHKVYSASGQRIENVGYDQIIVLSPPRFIEHSQKLDEAISKWVNDRLRNRSGEPAGELPVEVVQSLPGQKIFTFGAPSMNDPAGLISDPIVMVVNAGTKVLSPDAYGAFATGGGVLLENIKVAVQGARDAGLNDFIIAYRLAGQNAAEMFEKIAQQMRVNIVNMLASFGVLLVTAIALAEIYSRKNAQRTFVMHISGWRFTQAHIFILAFEVFIALLIAGWSAVNTFLYMSRDLNNPMSHVGNDEIFFDGWLPIAMSALAIINLIFFIAALKIKTKKLILTRSPEAQS